MARRSLLLLAIILGAFFISTSMAAEEAPNECDPNFKDSCHDRAKAMKLKIIAIFVILVASMAGIALPQLSLKFPSFSMEKPLFFIVKAFASGVILSTGFMHVLPDSLANLESECLPDNPWHKFPFTTFIAMVSAVGTLMMDSFSMAVHHKRQRESSAVHASPSIHIHAHGHGHSLPVSEEPANKEGEVSHTLKRNRVIAMVLEIGIVVHSVIIGLSMGASQSPCTIKPLVVAICFHQFFEGMGLGGCILQAEYKLKTKSIMIFFFSVTTPLGIVLGIGVSNIYSDNSPTALIVLGVLNACSAGLLIYMALVDLLAADFMGKKLQESLKIQGWAYVAVFLGMGFMSLMAKWA